VEKNVQNAVHAFGFFPKFTLVNCDRLLLTEVTPYYSKDNVVVRSGLHTLRGKSAAPGRERRFPQKAMNVL
jgi:hypothetical protein